MAGWLSLVLFLGLSALVTSAAASDLLPSELTGPFTSMRSLQLVGVVWIVSKQLRVNAAINPSAAPIAIPYNTTTPVGPDGKVLPATSPSLRNLTST